MRNYLLKVLPGIYVSKNDPYCYGKILKYNQEHSKALYEMGKLKERQRETNEAIRYYQKAYDNGYYLAKSDYDRLTLFKQKKSTAKKEKGQLTPILTATISGLLVLLLLLLGTWGFKELNYNEKYLITEEYRIKYQVVIEDDELHLLTDNLTEKEMLKILNFRAAKAWANKEDFKNIKAYDKNSGMLLGEIDLTKSQAVVTNHLKKKMMFFQ